jgi:hypothetical protein
MIPGDVIEGQCIILCSQEHGMKEILKSHVDSAEDVQYTAALKPQVYHYDAFGQEPSLCPK